jgi:hypothetical protein
VGCRLTSSETNKFNKLHLKQHQITYHASTLVPTWDSGSWRHHISEDGNKWISANGSQVNMGNNRMKCRHTTVRGKVGRLKLDLAFVALIDFSGDGFRYNETKTIIFQHHGWWWDQKNLKNDKVPLSR